MPTDFAQQAQVLLRDPSQFQWYVIPLLAIVTYIYATEMFNKNWNSVFAGLAFFDILVDRGVLDRWAFLLALNTFVCGVAASGVLAWFHGARGRQQVQPLEITLLVLLGLTWTAAAALIVLA